MSQTLDVSSQDVKIEIQKTLMNINNVTLKIKRELEMINEIVRAEGSLANSIQEANAVLVSVAKKQGIKSIEDLLKPNDTEDEDHDFLNPTTIDMLTERMLSFMDSDQP